MTAKKKKSILIKVAVIFTLIVIISTGITAYTFYKKVFYPNITTDKDSTDVFYIPTGSSFNDVLRILRDNRILNNEASFRWVAERMNYPSRILPGKFVVEKDMSNRELLIMLRSGRQQPVKVTFNNIRTVQQLASVISGQLEADSSAITGLLANSEFLKQFNVTPENALSLFIPNTYEFYWNTSAKGFIERLAEEHQQFWNPKRLQKAAEINLSPVQVSVLASIVEQETNKNDEKPLIAGVYMNRYHMGWKLEADPTLIYAAQDFTIQRVLNIHKEIDSPYNTYMYQGLPPGPICLPSISSLKSVLNYEKHNYMFFCAKDDFSGYHAFARTYNQHLINARKFQRELNRRNIRS
jgi:peptidoglycan lytic transglycosylase G